MQPQDGRITVSLGGGRGNDLDAVAALGVAFHRRRVKRDGSPGAVMVVVRLEVLDDLETERSAKRIRQRHLGGAGATAATGAKNGNGDDVGVDLTAAVSLDRSGGKRLRKDDYPHGGGAGCNRSLVRRFTLGRRRTHASSHKRSDQACQSHIGGLLV